MAYLFNTPDQQREMLREIGADSIEALFAEQIPAELRLRRPLDVPPPETELELEARLRSLAAKNAGASARPCFLGGGAYDHFIPAAVDEIASRGEFYTAYTPYQAEASQGTLQTFFEYQTLVCQLTGMDVANASLYEGGSAVAEAAFMAMRVTDRHRRLVVLGSVHPEYRQTLDSYLTNLNCEVVVVPTPQGTADPDAVARALNDDTAALIIQQPNFFGCLEETQALCDLAHQRGAMAVVSFDPVSLGLLPRPRDVGADIAVAEGQSLGTPLQFGGPYLGMLACREEFVRKMPGRLIGETTDQSGRRCFVLNLQAREQHIRRDKATSNICTNQGLLALRATTHLALLGPHGLREAAELCLRKAHYAAETLARVPGVQPMFAKPFFKEFTLRVKGNGGAEAAAKRVRAAGFDVGPSLAKYPSLRAAGIQPDEALLVAVTEKRTKDEIDRLAAALGQVER